ncbi:MAG: hypothetical protein IVW52_20945, partial [Acidimicrobiales bacterium]|nr:hypothetical protein [Acidimicrobiales bacterium]
MAVKKNPAPTAGADGGPISDLFGLTVGAQGDGHASDCPTIELVAHLVLPTTTGLAVEQARQARDVHAPMA